MKIKLLLCSLMLIVTHLASAALDTTKIMKRWKITKHTKKSKLLVDNPEDFIQFNHYHSYEQVLHGVYAPGKWRLNSTTNVLTINSGKETFDWKVSELTDRSLKASNGHEILEMEAVTLPACAGDPYDPMIILCGKWKIADFHFHYSQFSKPGDYVLFFPDGTMEEVVHGVYKKVTWKYDGDNNQLVINNHTWNVKDLLQKKLVATGIDKGESLMLIKQ